MPGPASVRELDDDSVALLLEAYIDQVSARPRHVCTAYHPLDALCAALFGPGRCKPDGDANADVRLWKYACGKVGFTELPRIFAGRASPTWRDVFVGTCNQTVFFEWTAKLRDAAGFEQDIATVRELLGYGVNVNAHVGLAKSTALMYAAIYESTEIAELLLAAGADVDAVDRWDMTALMYAVHNLQGLPVKNRVQMARILIGYGANVNAFSIRRRVTPLIIASRKDQLWAIDLLLDFGADKELCSSSGATALIEAVKAGHLRIVQKLLWRGANVNALDDSGWTALRHATEGLLYDGGSDKQDIIDALMDRGGTYDGNPAPRSSSPPPSGPHPING